LTHIFCDYFKFTLPGELTDADISDLSSRYFGVPFNRYDKLYKSRDRYADCYSMNDLVSVYRTGFAYNKGTTCFDISAAGLKHLPDINIVDLCRLVLREKGNLCRYDLTADDTRNVLPYDEMAALCVYKFKERVKTKLCRNRTDPETGEVIPRSPDVGMSHRRIKFGSEQSKNYLVIYDKEYVNGVSYPFLRVELRLTERQDTAALARQIASGVDVPSYLAGVIRGKLDFLQDNVKKKSGKISMPWWDDFLIGATAQKLKRDPPKTAKDLTQSRDIAIIGRAFNRLISRKNGHGLTQVFKLMDQARYSPEVCDIIGSDLNF